MNFKKERVKTLKNTFEGQFLNYINTSYIDNATNEALATKTRRYT